MFLCWWNPALSIKQNLHPDLWHPQFSIPAPPCAFLLLFQSRTPPHTHCIPAQCVLGLSEALRPGLLQILLHCPPHCFFQAESQESFSSYPRCLFDPPPSLPVLATLLLPMPSSFSAMSPFLEIWGALGLLVIVRFHLIYEIHRTEKEINYIEIQL